MLEIRVRGSLHRWRINMWWRCSARGVLHRVSTWLYLSIPWCIRVNWLKARLIFLSGLQFLGTLSWMSYEIRVFSPCVCLLLVSLCLVQSQHWVHVQMCLTPGTPSPLQLCHPSTASAIAFGFPWVLWFVWRFCDWYCWLCVCDWLVSLLVLLFRIKRDYY